MQKRIFYIAGPITGQQNYKAYFNAAETFINGIGGIALNPAVLPEGLPSHSHYMRITLAMLAESDAVVFLPGWLGSKGSRMEHIRALEIGLLCYELDVEFSGGAPICSGLKPMPKLEDLKSEDLVALHQVIDRTREVWGGSNGS